MAYRFFNIPAMTGGGDEAAELNAFLHGHKVVAVHREFAQDGAASRWCFCVEYLDGTPPASVQGGLPKVDYREVLDEAQFARFRKLREARKRIAEEDGVPVYAVFSNDQLAEMARCAELPTIASLKKIPGIGEKKVARYGERFVALLAEEEAGFPSEPQNDATEEDGKSNKEGGASSPGEP